MKRLRLVFIALAVTGLSFGAVACGDDSGDSGSSSGGGGEATLDLVIGDSLPLSGDLADFGPPGEKAADLAIEEINSAIEESGADHTVEIVHEDNGGGADPQAAVQAARKLVDSDGASCIAGAWASSDTIPTAESVTIPGEVVLISPASTSDEITGLDDDGLVNRTAPPDSLQGPTLADYMDQELGAEGTTVNVGARNDAYGTGLAETFSAAWEGLGGEIGESEIYDIKLPSYDSEAGTLTSGNPDATVIVDFPETYNKVGPALVRAGFDPTTGFVTDGLISAELAESTGEEAVEGLRGTAPGVPDDDTASKAFDEAYNAFEPKDIERMTFDAQNFDAVVLCYLSAVAAGSTEGADMAETLTDISAPPGDEYTWEELPEAIDALEAGDDIDYSGASGAIDMDENGDATAGVYDIYEFRNGAPVPIDEVAVASSE
ncbi:MAG: ABC transporter substrate-binding protein [Solirubrobacterales bacterium]|nr:ABC transporter substrate-binding protein [Solirubrobacterales bacterium]